MSRRQKKAPEQSPEHVRDAAMRLLARREHGVTELRYKLIQRGYEAVLIDECLAELQQRNWLDELRYVGMMCRQRAGQGKGPRWLRAELSAKGIADEVIETGLSESEVDWLQAAAVALRRIKPGTAEPKMRQKLYQRGFDGGQIDLALQLCREETG